MCKKFRIFSQTFGSQTMSFENSESSQSFVHLHLHTQYSLLDGAIRLKDLMKKVKEFNMPAVAQTDHGNMFGAIDFYTQCKDAGIKPILGSEIYFTPGSRHERGALKKQKVVGSQDEMESKHQIHHLILLCKNNVGYENLCKLLSAAYLEGFYYKPRADFELLEKYKEGLICTTACLKGEVGYNFFSDQDDRAVRAIHKLHQLFGDDFYLEIQENGLQEQKIVNEKVVAYSREHGINLVATNDCHYLTKEDAGAQEVLLCVQTGKNFNDEQRMRLTTTEFYFKSAEEMRERFHYAPEACDNTLKIADKCNVEFHWKDALGNQIYHLPDYPIETEETPEEYFTRKSREGMEERFLGPHFKKLREQSNFETEIKKKYLDRLEEEIQMIIKMGFPGYFLIVSDFIQWAKKNGCPVGPGRGSGAGSIVAYALSITNIDPIPFNLLFERFINPERVSMPDFDVDFCQDNRYRVIDYVTKKYGEDRVGQIITFGKLQAKAVIKDVSRVFGLSFSEADVLSKLIPEELKMTIDKAIELEPKISELMESDSRIKQIINISRRLEGLLRHASIHAAGVIITNKPLVNYCPLFKGREGEKVIQFDKDFSEKIGLVKFDFLGLKTLTLIENACQLIRRDVTPEFDIEHIDMEDPKVFEFISKGETVGVFQLESSGMIDLCKRIAPGSIDDISAINALYRPGPLESGMVDEFIEIKHGRKETQYPFPSLEPVLKDTYGVIIYQEQVMNVARIVAGYSLGQADMLRRAMGKKKADEMAKHRELFLQGGKERGYDQVKANDLFDKMEKFAEYGFNKSHAVAYSYLSYQTAFLKYYYPSHFFAALLTSELGNMDKITQYILDAKRFGIEVLPPDVNESLWQFNVVGKNIRFGMGAVKNVGEGAVLEIIKEREERGPFQGILDFCQRINLKNINNRVMESLIKVGAFDESEKIGKRYNRKTLLQNLELIVQYCKKRQEDKEMGLVSLFDFGAGNDGLSESDDHKHSQTTATESDNLDIEIFPEFLKSELLSYESELLGIFISGHPLDEYKALMEELASMPIKNVEGLLGREQKRSMTLSGLIVSKKVILTKKGDKMCFLNLEDLTGKIEVIVFPKVFKEFEALLESTETPVLIEGDVNLNETPKKMLATKILNLKEQGENKVTGVRITVNLEDLAEHKLQNLKDVLMSYRGSIPLHLIIESEDGRARLPLGDHFLINPTPKLAYRINEVFNKNAVKFIVDGRLEDVHLLTPQRGEGGVQADEIH